MRRGFVESCVVLLLLQENKPVGFSVLQLAVTDRDSSHNGPPFFFSIVSGNKEGAFEVNQQGALLTAAAINRKVKDHYLLHIKVLTVFLYDFVVGSWIRAALVVILFCVNSLHCMRRQN